jgi:transcription termination factor NusB
MPGEGLQTRRAAYAVLEQVRAGKPFEAAFDRAVKRLAEVDRRLVHELAAGVLRGQSALDARLAPLVPRGWESVAPELKEVLRLGAFQLTALAEAQDPVAMARAMGLAVEAGRLAFLAGRMPRREVAVPSSPGRGMLE